MLGKDGRPLSPLSAAIARKKQGLDPYDEDPSVLPTDIRPCPCCGRNFAADRLQVHLEICRSSHPIPSHPIPSHPTRDRLQVHLEICRKVTVNSAQRQTWDSHQQRLNGSIQAISFNGTSSSSPSMQAMSRRGGASDPRRTTSFSRREQSQSRGGSSGFGGNCGGDGRCGGGDYEGSHGGGPKPRATDRPGSRSMSSMSSRGGSASRGGGGSGGGMPANNMPKWKRDHAAFQAAVKAGRDLKSALESGVPLSQLPPPPPSDELDDRVQCPHCGRRFAEKAAERHIPKCASCTLPPATC